MTNVQTLQNTPPDIAKEFRDYVYGVSHDVSAPVRAMVEFSRLLTGDHARKLNEEGKLISRSLSRTARNCKI